jgi:hypothetical protein
MPKTYISAQLMKNGLGLTSPAEFPQKAQADEDNNINFVIAKPDDWDGTPMTLMLHGGVSEQPSSGVHCVVASGLGEFEQNIACGNPQNAAISTDVEEAFKVLSSVTVTPIGSGSLLRVNVSYYSESYGGKLHVVGATLTYAVV